MEIEETKQVLKSSQDKPEGEDSANGDPKSSNEIKDIRSEGLELNMFEKVFNVKLMKSQKEHFDANFDNIKL